MGFEIRHNVPLAPLTTFKIGGAAKNYASVKTEDDLHEALAWARKSGEPMAILSGGSNVLVSDNGFDGLVIHIEIDTYSFDGTVLTAGAGCNLLSLIKLSAQHGLGGWESMAGIPGMLGGAVRGNAGAFGTEIKDVAQMVRTTHIETGKMREFTASECDFSYRHSYFKDHPELIVTHAVVRLSLTDAAQSKEKIEATIAEREKRHLQNVMAAGSYFMNPVAPAEIVAQFEAEKKVRARENRVPAGWLIEKAGMKGASVGGATASMQHPNYLVNTGTATAKDVRELAEKVKIAVKERFGVSLIEEPALL